MFLSKKFKTLLSLFTVGIALQAVSYADTVIPGTSSPAGSINGIALSKFQADGGKLYCTSTVDSKIFILNSYTGAVLDVFDKTMGLLGPDDLFVDHFGNIYYTDTLGGFVGYIDTEARTMTPVTTPGQYRLINSITMSDDKKHIYAGVCFNELAPNAFIDIDLWNHTVTSLPLDFGFGCSVNGIAYQGGYVYGAQSITGFIYRVGPFNQPNTDPSLHVIVAGNSDAGQCQGTDGYFVNPAAVKFDSQGRLYVLESLDNTLHRIDNPHQDNQTPVFVGQLPLETGVDNLAIDKNNNDRMFISSSLDGYIIEVNPADAQPVATLEPNGLVLPLGVAIVGPNRALVTDYGSLRLVDTLNKAVIESFQTTTKGFLCNDGIVATYAVSPFVIAGNTHAVISNILERRIQIFDFNTNTVLADLETLPEGFGSPMNVVQFPTSATDSRPSVISLRFNTATGASNVVQNIYDQTTGQLMPGTLLFSLPPHVFPNPPNPPIIVPALLNGIATDGSNIYIGELFTGLLYRLNISNLHAPHIIAGGFAQPEGLALDNDGNLLVVELALKRLTKLNLTNNFGVKTTVATNLPIQSANAAVGFLLVSGVAVDHTNGDIYYTGTAPIVDPNTGEVTARVLNRIPSGSVELDVLQLDTPVKNQVKPAKKVIQPPKKVTPPKKVEAPKHKTGHHKKAKKGHHHKHGS